jgi:hypothetical protein
LIWDKKITMHKFFALALGFTMILAGIQNVSAQDKNKDAKKEKAAAQAKAVDAMLQTKHFQFRAITMSPMSGRMRQLTSEYGFKLSPVELQCYLPYFGKAYSAPIGESGGGYDFISKDFEYTIKQIKSEWEVKIHPKDVKNVSQMILRVFDNGTASLQVTSNQRQPISYNGNIEEEKPKK